MPYHTLPHDHGGHEHLHDIQELLSKIENFQIIADVFRHLGDTTRVRIFWLLCHMEECVVNIASMLEMSSPAVSHHLRPLKASGLLVSRRDGKEVYYRASETPQSQLLHQMIEQVMEIACPKIDKLPDELDHTHCCHRKRTEPAGSEGSYPCESLSSGISQTVPAAYVTKYHAEQLNTIRSIHDELTQHLDRRQNVEEIARENLMSPTTLKALFKDVYGVSIAAHIREHRMEEAARLLKETSLSIADIARAVGYESQSKFTAAFKSYYQVLPKDFRKGQ